MARFLNGSEMPDMQILNEANLRVQKKMDHLLRIEFIGNSLQN